MNYYISAEHEAREGMRRRSRKCCELPARIGEAIWVAEVCDTIAFVRWCNIIGMGGRMATLTYLPVGLAGLRIINDWMLQVERFPNYERSYEAMQLQRG